MHKIDKKLKEEETEISKIQKDEGMLLKYLLPGNFLNFAFLVSLCIIFSNLFLRVLTFLGDHSNK